LVHQQPRKWNSLLPWAKYWYNTTYHASTGRTPFQALYGRLPPTISHYQIGQSPVHEVNQQLLARDVLWQHLKENLNATSNRMKQVVDSKRRDIEFQEGDLVYLKLHPHRQQTMFKCATQKLARRFYDPYLIERRIGKMAYQLKLLGGPVFTSFFMFLCLKRKLVSPVVQAPHCHLLRMKGSLNCHQNPFWRRDRSSMDQSSQRKVWLNGVVCQLKIARKIVSIMCMYI
jgi:hypothetical protein